MLVGLCDKFLFHQMQLQHPHGCSFYSEIGGFWFARPLLQLPEGKRFVLNCTPCGTDGYIAPDFLINKEMGQKSDILSFGVVRNLLPCYLYKPLSDCMQCCFR